MDLISGAVDQTSSSEAKIALSRSLFRGCDDVYPRRFESRKTGRSGYAPACANEWVRGVPEAKSGRWGQGLTKAKMAECQWLKPVLVGQFEFLEGQATTT